MTKTLYSNLQIQPSKGANQVIEFLTGISEKRLELNASEYDAVVGFFTNKDYDQQSAQTIGYIVMAQAKTDNVPVFEILDSLSTTTNIELSQIVAEILNSNRYKTSVLGYKNERSSNSYANRNIKA